MRYPGELMIVATIVLAAIAAGGYLLTIYNSLVALKNQIARSWSNIDVLLKQRHDELPKLVSVCEGYMRHEREVFDKLSDARAALAQAKSLPERAQAASVFRAGIFFMTTWKRGSCPRSSAPSARVKCSTPKYGKPHSV